MNCAEYPPLDGPRRVVTRTASLDTGRAFTAATPPRDILRSDGRRTHASVFFNWDVSRKPDEAVTSNWDGARLSLWAETDGIAVLLADFVVGAAGMTPSVSGDSITVIARSGLVLAAQNGLCDAFILRGENPGPTRFTNGLAILETWCPGVAQ